jgi:hypothetical protein
MTDQQHTKVFSSDRNKPQTPAFSVCGKGMCRQKVRPVKADPEFSLSNIFLNLELVFPFEVCIAHFKDWRFWRYLMWYAIAIGRGGWITTENVKRICAQLGLRYESERHAFGFAVEMGYATRGEGDRGKKTRGVYHFKSVAEVARLCGLSVRKRKPGDMREKAQSLGDVVIMTKNLLTMDSMAFKGLVAANGGKILCKKDAQQKRMLKRYWQQYREKGWWDNWVTDLETGEKFLTKGTWDQLKAISHWKRDNYCDKIPLTGKEIWYGDVQHHIKQKNNLTNLEGAECEVALNGEASASGNSAELCIGPAQHISIAFCAAQFTRIDTTGHTVGRTGYYSTVRTTSPLPLSSVKATAPRIEMGRKTRKPKKIRTTSIEQRFRQFRFSTLGQKDFRRKPVPEADLKHEYHVFVKPLSNRNIANVVDVSTNTIRNHALRNFGGCAEMRKHICIFGKEHESTHEILDFLNQRSKTLPHDLQFGASMVKTNSLKMSENTAISQLGLTEYVDLGDLGQNVAIIRPKSTFVFAEEHKLGSFKRKSGNETVKSGVLSVETSADLSKEGCSLSRGRTFSVKATLSSPQKEQKR